MSPNLSSRQVSLSGAGEGGSVVGGRVGLAGPLEVVAAVVVSLLACFGESVHPVTTPRTRAMHPRPAAPMRAGALGGAALL